MRVIDLTHTIKENMPVYPGTVPPKLIPANSYEEDGFKETLLQMYTHTGTHMDPPAHIFVGRTTLDEFPPEQFIGKALVIDCHELREGEVISMEHIWKARENVKKADFLLFYLGWASDGERMLISEIILVWMKRYWTSSYPEPIKVLGLMLSASTRLQM